jgi:hypothetical protein
MDLLSRRVTEGADPRILIWFKSGQGYHINQPRWQFQLPTGPNLGLAPKAGIGLPLSFWRFRPKKASQK